MIPVAALKQALRLHTNHIAVFDTCSTQQKDDLEKLVNDPAVKVRSVSTVGYFDPDGGFSRHFVTILYERTHDEPEQPKESE